MLPWSRALRFQCCQPQMRRLYSTPCVSGIMTCRIVSIGQGFGAHPGARAPTWSLVVMRSTFHHVSADEMLLR